MSAAASLTSFPICAQKLLSWQELLASAQLANSLSSKYTALPAPAPPSCPKPTLLPRPILSWAKLRLQS